MQPIHRVDLKNRETEISRQIGPDGSREKKPFFFFFSTVFAEETITSHGHWCVRYRLYFFFSPLPSPLSQDDIPPGRNTSGEKFPSVMKATKNYERRESSRNATIYARLPAHYLSPAIRYSELLTNVTRGYETIYDLSCMHALHALVLTERREIDDSSLPSPPPPPPTLRSTLGTTNYSNN